jgi:hypothetical protein
MTRKEFLIIAIATLITIIAWVSFDILHARAIVKPTPDVEDAITPIDPNFNTGVLK